MKLNRKHAFLAVGLTLAGLSVPSLRTRYQRYRANTLIEQTEAELGHLERKIHTAQECTAHNTFLTPAEREGVRQEIACAQEKIPGVQSHINALKGAFDRKAYQSVRTELDPVKAVEETPYSTLQRENTHLEQQLGLCKDKRDLRNTVLSNELFLKARLKKPENRGLELTDDVALLGEDLRKYIPPFTSELETALGSLDAKLYNSLGAHLVSHQPSLFHIQEFGRTEAVRQTARGLYDAALNAYIQVKPLNDKLVWYRPTQDGTYDRAGYQVLLSAQKPVVELIRTGDNQLQSLNRYLEELHNQYWIYVVEHTRHGTSKTVSHYTDDGIELETVGGYRFGYVLRTKNPVGERDEEVIVGIRYKDEFTCGSFIGCSWDYAPDQTIGFVREWKRLHYDRKDMPRGMGLNPHFETE